MTKIFIDGSAGTTGLRIYERLGERKDLELIILDDAVRKDLSARKEAINASDIAFLCLPDAAAIEAVSLIENDHTAVIDTSTAHRTNETWAYGFPEISGNYDKIRTSKRIANPGCHASGFISLVAPLTENGLLKKDVVLSCTSLTGYSGGGKKMIAQYEDPDRDHLLDAPRAYGLTQVHKHLPEMKKVCGLDNAPVFVPIVADFYSGMEVIVPLSGDMLNCKMDELKDFYRDYYKTGLVHFKDSADDDGLASAAAFSMRDDMEITVTGNEDRILLISRFDNLGKGASGAAIQNMNILLGIDETTGLNI